jgi:hypothetical protein
VSCFIAHTKTLDTLIQETDWWWRPKGYSIWYRPLQVESTKCVGWLLYGLGIMDESYLMQTIFNATGFHTAIRFHLIKLGRHGAIPDEYRVRALHVDVAEEQYEQAHVALHNLFRSSGQDNSPIRSRMRLVPEKDRLSSPRARVKADRLRNRQANFEKMMGRQQNWEIADLDFSLPLAFCRPVHLLSRK